MSCKCSKYPSYLYREDLPESVISKFEVKETSMKTWKSLYECRICSQLWVIDVWEKYNPGIALKINCSNCWESIDFTPLEKDLLLKSRGGTTNEKCIMINCVNYRVKNVVYCLEHLYQDGARR